MRVVTRQMLPGITTAFLLGFGRGIGDASSVLFAASHTDRIPTSLMRPTHLAIGRFLNLVRLIPRYSSADMPASVNSIKITSGNSVSARASCRQGLNQYTIK
ncbi:hypothetical protein [Candidatus Villigracilis saccharophilus]|uniref:hypothetical protein n=1 Tax=Candidatus Villigracilis saccharophilus TaxID=3140684 RepID=UPI003136C5B1|nr:hypothetical protein [Anaerolineales bacterium]